MKRMIPIVLAAALALSACGSTTVYAVSADVQGSADGLYVAAEKAGEVAVANKVIPAATFRADADMAYTALLTLRAARTAGTASSAAAALTAFNTALNNLQTLVGATPTSASN